MNWINVLSHLFFAVLITGAAGTVMFLCWFLCRKALTNLSPKLVYHMLKWVVVMFLLPIPYLNFLEHYKSGYVWDMGKEQKMLLVINLDNKWFQILAVLWLAATICAFCFFLKNEWCKYQICKSNFDDGNSLVQKEFEQIKAGLGIKGKVTLLRNDSEKQKSPFVIGIWNRKVVLPYLDYSEEELKVILYHELNHVKKRDIIFRYLTLFAIILNSLNPFTYFLWEHIQLWAEADCDARTIDCLEKDGISKRQYYNVIWNLNELHTKKMAFLSYPMLISAAETFYRRILIMKSYHTKQSRLIKMVVYAGMAACALVSTTAAQAAGVCFAKLNDEVLYETQVITRVRNNRYVDHWSNEIIFDTDDSAKIMHMNNDSDERSGSVEWCVPKNTRYIADTIYYMPKDTRVQIGYVVEQEECLYRCGIMHEDGKCIVIEGTGAVSHSFRIQEDGYYYIMIENCGDSTLSVYGAYQY